MAVENSKPSGRTVSIKTSEKIPATSATSVAVSKTTDRSSSNKSTDKMPGTKSNCKSTTSRGKTKKTIDSIQSMKTGEMGLGDGAKSGGMAAGGVMKSSRSGKVTTDGGREKRGSRKGEAKGGRDAEIVDCTSKNNISTSNTTSAFLSRQRSPATHRQTDVSRGNRDVTPNDVDMTPSDRDVKSTTASRRHSVSFATTSDSDADERRVQRAPTPFYEEPSAAEGEGDEAEGGKEGRAASATTGGYDDNNGRYRNTMHFRNVGYCTVSYLTLANRMV